MDWCHLIAVFAERLVLGRVVVSAAERRNHFADMRCGSEVAGHTKLVFFRETVPQRKELIGHSSAKLKDGLVGVADDLYADTRISQPADDFDIALIAILRLVDDDLDEASR